MIRQLGPALQKTRFVTELSLDSNKLSPMQGCELFKVLKNNTTIRGLKVQNNDLSGDVAIEIRLMLESNVSLSILKLINNSLGPEGTAHIAKGLAANSHVSELQLDSNAIGSAGLQALSNTLKKNQSISTLHLQGNAIDEEGAVAFGECLEINKTLTYLSLSNAFNESFVVRVLSGLQKNQSVLNLNINKNSLSSDAQSLGALVKSNHKIKVYSADEIGFNDQGCISLADALKVNQRITKLWLQKNSIGPTGCAALADALQVNKSLSRLNLADNKIEVDGALALGKMLSVNNSLAGLYLSRNWMGRGVQGIAEGLWSNKSLNDLNLSENNADLDSCIAIASALEHNTGLKKLVFHSNYKGNYFKEPESGTKVSKAFARSLEVNSTLNVLDLSKNYNLVTCFIIQALRKNQSLKSLIISHCSKTYESDAAFALCEALKTNTTLSCFESSIKHNAPELLQILGRNGSITAFGITSDQHVEQICERNIAMHNQVRLCVLTVLAIFRISYKFPYDLARKIACYLWNTRHDLRVWNRTLSERSAKKARR